MLLLSCSDLARAFDAEPLFQGIGFELHGGERVGLVGPNGVGKTTLLRLLAGADQPDTGDVRLHAGARVALLSQQPEFTPGVTVFEAARKAFEQLVAAHDDMIQTAEALARSTEEAEHKRLTARYDRLNELLRSNDAYNLDHRIEYVLEGIGFSAADYGRLVETLSGGQQRRLMLATLLLAAPDVMLLDEPSNHLDIDGTRWLEGYLSKQAQGMLIVSHDRYFLDRVVTRIFELHGGRLTAYPGNYHAYVELRQQRYEQQLKTWQAQHEYIAKQEEYIRRVHYGQLHKQAQSRQKALDRLERVERPTLLDTPHMHFGAVRRSGDIVVEARDIAKAYDRPLFDHLSFALRRGQRLGIMGPNGCGKTTLLRILMGQEQPDEGMVQQGHLVEYGYYDQQLNSLADDIAVMDAVWSDADPDTKEQQIRDLLARFGLTGEQVKQGVGELSGGERSRAALARLVALGVNVLVLDEPTNHLDLWAREALEAGLREFEGTVIVVSHDRYFLNRVVDLLLVMEGPGRTQVIYGNYDTYERMRTLQSPAPDAQTAKASAPVDDAPAAKRKPKRRFPYRKVEELEAEITTVEERVRELEEQLASPELYRSGERVKETMRAFEEAKADLQYLYEHWAEAVELN